jgi:hypothetical protein
LNVRIKQAWIHWFAVALLAALVGGVQAEEEQDPVQGYWEGEWRLKSGNGGKQTGEVVALGNGEYQAAFTAYDGGEMQKETFRFLINGGLVNDVATFATSINLGPLGTFDFKAVMKDSQFLADYTDGGKYSGTFKLKRVQRKPDSLLAPPLTGAFVLLDKDAKAWQKAWQHAGGAAPTWTQVGGAVQVARAERQNEPSHLASKQTFNDAQIHLEFRTPLLSKARGRERGDSGVFVQGRYEVQILDSFGQARPLNNFGQPDDDDSAGAIFKQKAPLENATLPPGEWQALDITFLAARYDTTGKATRPAEITVRLNDQLVQDRVTLTAPTEGAPIQDATTPAGLILQDSGYPVQFRNIWWVDLNPAAK